MSRYRTLRLIGTGPDGPVEAVAADRLGAGTLARRRVPVPVGPRRSRLREQSESLARLGHPCIATVDDIADLDEAVVEVLTTLGTDGSLADRPVLRAPGPEEARRILRALADALSAAHGVGVAHGHVTPSNVVFIGDKPLLTDFGITEARTGRPDAHPFRTDVRDLATLGVQLLDGAGPDTGTDSLRRVLQWVADDPDATLQGLRLALAESPVAPPPPPPPAVPAEPVAAPDGRRTRPWVLAALGVLAIGLLGGAAGVLVSGADPDASPAPESRLAASSSCPPVRSTFAADVDGDGCDDPVEWQAADAEVAYPAADGTLLRFRVGRPGDELVLGDWNCDGTATAGVVRSSTGETFVFDAWAAAGETLVAEPGPPVPAGAAVTVAGDDGCDRIQPVRS